MTKDEALKLALEALKQIDEAMPFPVAKLAQSVIKEALAQPEHDKTDVRCECCGYMTYHREHLGCICAAKLKEPEQEPVAWMNDSTPSGIFARHIDGARNFGCTIPLYTTPPQHTWVGLTDEDDIDWEDGGNLKDLVKAIEAKLKQKNT